MTNKWTPGYISDRHRDEDYLTLDIDEDSISDDEITYPGILSLSDFAKTRIQGFDVLSYIENDCLRDKITKDESIIAYIARQSLLILHEFHVNGLVHRDFRSDFVVIFPDEKKFVLDKGEYCIKREELVAEVVGSPLFMAPEVIRGYLYDEKCDIWCYGTFLHEMVMLTPPYANEEPLRSLFLIATKGFPELEDVSDDLKDLYGLCVRNTPENRPSAEDLLKHPFFKKRASRKKFWHFVYGFAIGNGYVRYWTPEIHPYLTSDEKAVIEYIFITYSLDETSPFYCLPHEILQMIYTELIRITSAHKKFKIPCEPPNKLIVNTDPS